MSVTGQAKSRVILLFIAALFVGPVFFAGWLYYKGELIQPAGRANNGALLEPIINLVDVVPESPLYDFNPGYWLLTYQNRGNCDEACQLGLYTTRQLRLMLGKDIGRLRRIFLHGETLPDTVFLTDEHKGLISLQDEDLSDVLDQKRPIELAGGGYFLIDPHGNLVMYFHPGLAPDDIIDDIKRLLKLSRIG